VSRWPRSPSLKEFAAMVPTVLNARQPAPTHLLTLWLHLPVVLQGPTGRIKVRSSLEASLADCRQTTNRGSDGKVASGKPSGSWLGAMGYLALLDQVGNAVLHMNPARVASGNSGVERALAYFTTLSDDDAICIYALRNSLAHDFSLVNLPPRHRDARRRKLLTQLFTLADGPDALIIRPGRAWNPRRPNSGGPTIINVRALGDLVEQAIEQLRLTHAEGKVRLRLKAADGTPISATVWSKGRFFVHSV